uniref:Cadherin domain-containing protein n=1 Tax=Ditylenchus dipsaci TaxID=166011 RepID=A0A915DL30_9BILA
MMASGLWPCFGLLLLLCFGWIEASRYKHYHRVPIIDLNGAEELIGTIMEDERLVSLSPQLRILPETGPVCRYELTSISDSDLEKELPFESKVVNKTEGTVRITLRKSTSIDCTNNEWRMQVVAVRCADDSAKSEPVTLKITVKDTNNHSPQFEAPWYTFEVEEGKVAEIAHIYATDADCGHPYGKICRYEITNALDGNPFQIDDQGILSTTLPLNRSQAESHILTVVAHDCGMLHSKSTLVTVHVKPRCMDGIRNELPTTTTGKDDPKNVVNFSAGMGAKRIFSDSAEIVLCPRENTCTVKQVDAKITLNLKRRTDIDYEAAKQCGLKSQTLDLLPRITPEYTRKFDKNDADNDPTFIITGDKETGIEQKYFFDGKSNAVIVPPNTIKQVVPEKFTLSFSMQHKAGSKQDQSFKQNLLCESDDFGMNRHHFGVYLRHCKLELLLRREAENAESEFRAAEWRWETPTVCDGEWHSYAILFTDLDNVTLLVDGEKFEGTDRNPEILDDWPLHQTKQHKTRLVVGLAGMEEIRLWFNFSTPESVIKCLHGNKERLSIHSIDHLLLGESIVFDEQQTRLSLRANSLANLSSLIRQVEYVADDKNPSATVRLGKRTISVATQVSCQENQTIPLGTYKAQVYVVSPSTPQLSLSGLNLISANRRSLKTGSVMLPNMQITVTQNIDGMEEDVTSKYSLEWCKVHLKPARDMDLEYFSSPAALISNLNVEFEHDKQGIMLKEKKMQNPTWRFSQKSIIITRIQRPIKKGCTPFIALYKEGKLSATSSLSRCQLWMTTSRKPLKNCQVCPNNWHQHLLWPMKRVKK